MGIHAHQPATAESEREQKSSQQDTQNTEQQGQFDAPKVRSAGLTPRSVVQMQRQRGNQFVLRKVQASVQRAIEYDQDGIAKLPTLYDDAYGEIYTLSKKNLSQLKSDLDDGNPLKTSEFHEIWANPVTRNMLHELFVKAYFPENTNFLRAVERYKLAPTADKAVEIYNEYVKVGSTQEINISSFMRKKYDKAIATLQVNPNQVQGRGRANDLMLDVPQTRARN